MGKNKTSARITINFNVAKAEAGGYRYFIERQGKLVRGLGRKTKILQTGWFRTKAEAEKALKKAKRRWAGRI